MSRFAVDLHNHSCLSPCADDDMTPCNLAGMASLAGLDIVALTDHNSLRNCPAFFAAAERMGIIPVAGAELTTSEDIHVVFLLEHIDDALRLDSYIYSHLIKVHNRRDIYGRQLIYDIDDGILAEEEYLLSAATDISYDDTFHIAQEFNAIAYPAHIDREANSAIATLGTLPDEPNFPCVEIRHLEKVPLLAEQYPSITQKRILTGSDAHFLSAISDPQLYIELDANRGDADSVRRELFKYLSKGAEK